MTETFARSQLPHERKAGHTQIKSNGFDFCNSDILAVAATSIPGWTSMEQLYTIEQQYTKETL